ncbi:hypothetical protein [Rhizobium halophytocola]|uniref:Uncharacterized protein n=1 Tax=Rhizobium halophytocola TaxID=735519 RepID=A0ABS4E2H6_9HYPH|nr:hypothetical protein [Rhizobium halophytocola]MBP1852138.1 hypothetical protein [Rhizobium halophytocola]
MSSPFALRYDAAELATFLRAEILHAGDFAARWSHVRRHDDVDRRNAEKGERARVMREAQISREIFDRAWLGQPVSPADAHRIWDALGMDPAIRLFQETDR